MIALVGLIIVSLVYSIRILIEALAVLITLSLVMLGVVLGAIKALVVLGHRPARNDVSGAGGEW